MPSAKTKVIQYLFDLHWDGASQTLKKSVMTLQDVQDAIRHFTAQGVNLSDRNPANFMKDVVRGQNASRNWPKALTDLGYTAAQRTGSGNAFEFQKFKPGQTEPFPDVYKPTSSTPVHRISSVTIPLLARALGRQDEPWLIQTAVKLGIIETHFGLYSPLQAIELTHLQMSVKLRNTEIDALFLAVCAEEQGHRNVLITCEAKQARDRILEQQIIEQVEAAFKATAEERIAPVALRALRNTGYYLVEFAALEKSSFDRTAPLTPINEIVYELNPRVKGI
jgi:hypothetical protein